MTLEELGARLREKRIERGFSIEDIAARLKVPPRILKAIEEGCRDELPHTVYICSFVKSCGTLLGIDAGELAEMLSALNGGGSAVPEPIRPKGMMETQMDGERGHGAGLLFKLLLIALVGVGGYVYYTSTFREEMPSVLRFGEDRPARPDLLSATESGAPAENSADAPAGDAAQSKESGAPNLVAENPWGEPVTPQISGDEAVTQIAQMGEVPPDPAPLADLFALPEPDASGAENSVPPGSPEPGSIETPAAEENVSSAESASAVAASNERWTLRSPAGTRHRLVVTAREDCWLSASADADAARKGGTLSRGETFTAEFNDRLTLRLGNAGGVDVFYDGIKQKAPGKRGGVMTVTFPPR